MVIRIRKRWLLLAAVLLCAALVWRARPPGRAMVAGGTVRTVLCMAEEGAADADDSRFQRPSCEPTVENPDTFRKFQAMGGPDAMKQVVFDTPEDLLLAYYGILADASNMLGYSGGCGSIGEGKTPYPYAYALLTDTARASLPLRTFTDSFRGIGHLALLKLFPAAGDTADTRRYFVELELITGEEQPPDAPDRGSRFAYWYGAATVRRTREAGWRLERTEYTPQDFLCAPAHGWSYLADAVVSIVYQNDLGLVEQIDRVERAGSLTAVYASGHGQKYRFDFVRLTNGYDVLLHEQVREGDAWRETALLPDKWSYLKL